MNILIVDGNEKEASDKYTKIGMPTQFQVYEKIIRKLNSDCNIVILHPAYINNFIPSGINLDDFNGIVWTGSLLNIYDGGPPIDRQINLAKELFKNKNKIFGSCWGLQVLATAAGGVVRKNPNGLEAVIAHDITINNNGLNHPLYENKPKIFDSLCWHYDEIETLPSYSKVLSSNKKSSIQSICFNRDNSEVWAVQYHPEFDPEWIAGLMSLRKSLLFKEGIYSNIKDFNKLASFLSNVENNKGLNNKLLISETITDNKIHTIELSNWLNHLKNNT